MANIKSNLKTKRKSIKKYNANKIALIKLKNNIKKVKSSKDIKDLNVLYSMVDSLSKKGIIHKNKANRIKSINTKLFTKKNEIKK